MGCRSLSARSDLYRSIVPSFSNAGNVKLVESPGRAGGFPILVKYPRIPRYQGIGIPMKSELSSRRDAVPRTFMSGAKPGDFIDQAVCISGAAGDDGKQPSRALQRQFGWPLCIGRASLQWQIRTGARLRQHPESKQGPRNEETGSCGALSGFGSSRFCPWDPCQLRGAQGGGRSRIAQVRQSCCLSVSAMKGLLMKSSMPAARQACLSLS